MTQPSLFDFKPHEPSNKNHSETEGKTFRRENREEGPPGLSPSPTSPSPLPSRTRWSMDRWKEEYWKLISRPPEEIFEKSGAGDPQQKKLGEVNS